MIPIQLTVRNFLSYGDVPETLTFEGLHLFCLAGDNGHGKSALLDAMTWCLWGESRAATQDELVHAGETEMTVIFDFELHGDRYQVLRNRKLRKGPSTTVLELRVQRDGEFVPLTGNSVEETETALVKLLGLGYRTFVNSAFLLQGRADEFTKKTPAERKQILAEVLNLQQFELLEREARDRLRTEKANGEELERRIRRLDSDLSELPAVEAAQILADVELTGATTSVDQARTAEQQLRAQREELRSTERRAAELQSSEKQTRHELTDVLADAVRRQAEVAEAEAALAQEPDLRRGYQAWRAATQALGVEHDKLARLQPLQTKASELRHAIERYETDVRYQIQTRERELQARQLVVEAAARAENELAAVELRAAEVVVWEVQHGQAAAAARLASEEASALKAQQEILLKRVQELRDYYKMLQSAEAVCPVCRSPLDGTRKHDLHDSMKAEAEERKAEAANNDGRLKDLEASRRVQEELARGLAESIRQGSEIGQQIGRFREQVLKGREAETECSRLNRELNDCRRTMERRSFLTDEQAELSRLQDEMAAIAFDPATTQQLATECRRLERYREALELLDDARKRRTEALAALDHVELRRKDVETRQRLITEALLALQADLEAIPMLDAALQEQRVEVGVAELRQRTAFEDRARIQARLAQMALWSEDRTQRRRELVESKDRESITAELVTAFGKNGVQAMVIEQAIPAIQDEANRLLDRMTDSQMTVTLETQRLGRAGDVKETLDIKIADMAGARRYEMFSGGEAFRVNLALRVALSRYLAQRAGTRLQTLVIDEGFGSQDSKGRERLVEVLNTIQSDFEKIMVITHVDDLKESFPHRIDVVKDERGSHIVSATG